MKPFKQYVTELFDKPVRWKLDTENPYRLTYEAKIDGTTLSVDFLNKGNEDWEMVFDVNGKSNVTGGGNEIAVFSTVLDIMKDFDKRTDAQIIRFDAAKGAEDGSSREKLYDRFVRKFASSHGYNLVDKRDIRTGNNTLAHYVLKKGG